ncbi:MAG: hypothetical protein NXI19_20820 [Alphaproteobacteria bacterium]|nr:hypothetical protein [Alphaproteobacteria bacterium]
MNFDFDIAHYGLNDSDSFFLGLAQDQYPSLTQHPLVPLSCALKGASSPKTLSYSAKRPLLIDGEPACASQAGHPLCVNWIDKLRSALQPLRLDYLEIATPPQPSAVRPVPSTVISMLASFISQPIPNPEGKNLPRDITGVFQLQIEDGCVTVSAHSRTKTPRRTLTKGQQATITQALEATRRPGEIGTFANRRDDVNKLARMMERYLAASGVRALIFSVPLVSDEPHWASV